MEKNTHTLDKFLLQKKFKNGRLSQLIIWTNHINTTSRTGQKVHFGIYTEIRTKNHYEEISKGCYNKRVAVP